jgi:hypothetical protein
VPTTCPGAIECPRYVFLTTKTVDGNMGGAAGGDKLCQQAADNGVAPIKGRRFKAWLSSAGKPASARLVHGKGLYKLADETLIAPNFDLLLSGPRAHAINVSETKIPNTAGGPVWTGTSDDGLTARPGEDCSEWSTVKNNGDVGELVAVEHWSFNANISCGLSAGHLYCFEE